MSGTPGRVDIVRRQRHRSKLLLALSWRRTYDLSPTSCRVVGPKPDERATQKPDRKGRVLTWYSVVKEVGTQPISFAA
jgi:hypothetical protein